MPIFSQSESSENLFALPSQRKVNEVNFSQSESNENLFALPSQRKVNEVNFFYQNPVVHESEMPDRKGLSAADTPTKPAAKVHKFFGL